MKLFASLTSPFARKIRVMLLEKNISCELVVDIPWNEETHVPDYNPLGKVPVLLTDSGEDVYDSRVIAQYLETLPSSLKLVPDEPAARIAVLKLEALADGICDAAALIYLEHARRPPEQRNADWQRRQELKIERGLVAIEKYLPEGKWCVGNNYSLADIAIGSMLGYLDLRFAHIDWRSQQPKLATLAERLDGNKSFQQTMPPK